VFLNISAVVNDTVSVVVL